MRHQQNILAIIESCYDTMTDVEKRIADYFLNPTDIEGDLSSLEVAQTLHISQAALTRFAKKCGFKGYREFNFQYLQQLKISKTEHTNLKNDSSRQVLRNYIQICEALTDADGFAWTTSILDKNCLVIGFSLSGQTPSIIDSLIDAKGMGAKTVLITGQPDLIKEDFSEIIPVAMQSKPQFIQRISAQFPMLLMIDILYAFFLEIDRERKEKIFNSYWENHKLNGYYRRHQ